MVLRKTLTPESFLEAPRRSAAVPSPSGRVAFFTVSTHRFVDNGNAPGTSTKELFLLDLATGTSWPFSVGDGGNDVSQGGDLAWVPRNDACEATSETTNDDSDDNGIDELLWLRPATASEPDGTTTLIIAAATYQPGQQPAWPPYVAGVVPAPVSALRLHALPDGTVALAVAGLVGPDGALFNEPAQPPAGSSARIYDTWQVRSWDQYLRPQPYAIWYSLLARTASAGTEWQPGGPRRQCWQLASALHNALQHAPPRFEAPLGIYEPGDATSAYDIGAQGVVFTVRDPAPANPHHTSCSDVYYVPLDSFAAPTAYKPVRISVVPSAPVVAAAASAESNRYSDRNPPGLCANPRFSPDGTMLAFLWASLACPADQRLFMGHIVAGAVHDVVATTTTTATRPQNDALGGGGECAQSTDDLPVPSAFEFAPTGRSVFLHAHYYGRRSVFVMDLWGPQAARPRLVSGQRGSVDSFYAVHRYQGEEAKGRGSSRDRLSAYAVLLSGSSFVESSFYQMVNLMDADGYSSDNNGAVFEPRVISTAGSDGSRFGLSYSLQVSEMYFEGGGAGEGSQDDNYFVQAWVVRPLSSADGVDANDSDADADNGSPPAKKRPLALFIHGGPEGAFEDEWHMRWNAAVWAAQGYVVVLPNITGSVGFGLAHTTRIYDNWGGAPYDDLVQCMAALRGVPDIDCTRAIVAGASYGGYMVAWLQGSPLGRAFSAAICHDPVFSTELMGLTSDVSDGIATFAGSGFAWENADHLARWNPARPDRLAAWRTNAAPTLVVHSDRDYRCVVTEGQAMFRALVLQGVPARYLNFPDESHFVTRTENSLVWHRVVFAWLRQWRDVRRRVFEPGSVTI
ncbi:MAG: hypothetical protein STHCBS139747_007105 [Sporothrix thermara]